jgi:hypothetical protein
MATNRNDGFRRWQHCGIDIERREFDAACFNFLAALVDVIQVHVRVGKDDLVDVVAAQQIVELFLGSNGNPVGIQGARQYGWIAPVFYVWNLRCCECNDFDIRVVSITAIEYVEVTSSGSHDDYLVHWLVSVSSMLHMKPL